MSYRDTHSYTFTHLYKHTLSKWFKFIKNYKNKNKNPLNMMSDKVFLTFFLYPLLNLIPRFFTYYN